MKIIYGTSNAAKLEYMRKTLSGLSVEILSPSQAGISLPEVEESAETPLANARAKALAYSKAAEMPVFSCDNGLYFDNLPEKEPAAFVRRPFGQRLNDAQMTAYYAGLAKKYGGIIAHYKKAVCLVASGRVFEAEICGRKFLLTDKPHPKAVEGFPLGRLSVNLRTVRYFYDEERAFEPDRGFVRFFKEALEKIK